ncbi:uncharacterized protein LTR77_000447 [Saxophila tyrrhenica]|uniref:Amine oxidase domain-containing protein n=1 Tax=Saxophila tyrrhenica TaxID=1690608 RepID=A0AAV9PMP4_9PEZI|nr:hypothetical protein LTR77_000447 [Saxophila tyrrhenica]
MQPKGPQKKKVAIVGSGCAGLGAAWGLKGTEYEIHLFEQEDRLGGHTNTQPFNTPHGNISVDTGFIVMNSATYPNFINFLKHLNVPIVPTQMTFSVSRDSGKFEWSGDGKGLFAQRRNLFRLRHWRLIFDVIRFNQFALDLLYTEDEEAKSITIGTYLQREGYSEAFRDDYLIPMTAAVWSTSPDKASLEFPAQTLVRFMWNHHLLSTLAARPDWLTIPGGSKQYIDAIEKDLGSQLHIHRGCKVTGLVRPPQGTKDSVAMAWKTADGKRTADFFHHVVLACHGDQILPIIADDTQLGNIQDETSSMSDSRSFVSAKSHLSDPKGSATPLELSILSAFRTTANTCYLHSDPTLLPTRPATWSSWNYLIASQPSHLAHPAGVSLTYDMNILQHIPRNKHGHVLVTMNPPSPPRASLTQGRFEYRHPLYTVEAVRAQERLEEIQDTRGVSYAGAWTKYGFHEDGFSSGLRVAREHLGAELGFGFKDATFSRGQRPVITGWDYLLRIAIMVVGMLIVFWELVGSIPLVWIPLRLAVGVLDRVLGVMEEVGVID